MTENLRCWYLLAIIKPNDRSTCKMFFSTPFSFYFVIIVVLFWFRSFLYSKRLQIYWVQERKYQGNISIRTEKNFVYGRSFLRFFFFWVVLHPSILLLSVYRTVDTHCIILLNLTCHSSGTAQELKRHEEKTDNRK